MFRLHVIVLEMNMKCAFVKIPRIHLELQWAVHLDTVCAQAWLWSVGEWSPRKYQSEQVGVVSLTVVNFKMIQLSLTIGQL